MKLRMLRLIAVVGVLLAGCTSKDLIKPNQQAIDAYVQSHPDLPELDKSCIYDGRFEIGIKVETLQFLLGEPLKMETVQQPWAVQQKWVYRKGGRKIFIVEDKHVVGILEEQ